MRWDRRLWTRLPARLRRGARPLGVRGLSVARHARALWDARAPATRVLCEGRAHGGGHLRAALIGTPQELASLRRKLFAVSPDEQPAPPVSLRQLAAAVRSHAEADVVLALAPRWASAALPASLARFDEGVEVVVPVTDALARWRAGDAPLGKYRRRMERAGLTVSLTRDDADLARFHARFYLPYVRARFGDAADPRRLAFVQARDWELIRVHRGGEWIAGGVGLIADDAYRFLDVGYHDGDRAPLDDGAGHALYAAALERAAARGLPTLDLGPERPFLGDPGLRYKRQWGARLRATPWAARVLGVRVRDTEATRALFAQSPLARPRRGGMQALTPSAPSRWRDLGVTETRWPTSRM